MKQDKSVFILGVLENLFTPDGRKAHEVVFVFDARRAQDTEGVRVVGGLGC